MIFYSYIAKGVQTYIKNLKLLGNRLPQKLFSNDVNANFYSFLLTKFL